jgi:uncharacterized protein (DUF2062 family)
VVFKRRVKRTLWDQAVEGVWPRGGWIRSFEYIRHRVRRLPDTPEKIGRGIWAGVFASFTPFFGIHFIFALAIAKVARGNMLAALIGTFFGNPLTLLPISFISLNSGYFLLGTRPDEGMVRALPGYFTGAWNDLWHNIKAMFGPEPTEWGRLYDFYHDVFLPYLVGGLIPGIIVATLCYFLCVQLVRAYQNRRRNSLRDKLAQLKKNNVPPPDEAVPPS